MTRSRPSAHTFCPCEIFLRKIACRNKTHDLQFIVRATKRKQNTMHCFVTFPFFSQGQDCHGLIWQNLQVMELWNGQMLSHFQRTHSRNCECMFQLTGEFLETLKVFVKFKHQNDSWWAWTHKEFTNSNGLILSSGVFVVQPAEYHCGNRKHGHHCEIMGCADWCWDRYTAGKISQVSSCTNGYLFDTCE